MKVAKLLIFLVLIAPFNLPAFKYPVINYKTADGLPQNRINALIQSKLGFILVGTQSGIGKFDGTTFTVITKEHGLPHSFITDFKSDHHRNLWVATNGGLCKFDDTHNSISTFMTAKPIDALAVNKTSNRLWIISRNQLFDMDLSTEIIKRFNIPATPGIAGILKGITITPAGNRFLYTSEEILELSHLEDKPIKSNLKINILKTLGETVYCGTENGLFILQNHKLSPCMALPPEMSDVRDIAQDENQGLWVGTYGGLLYRSADKSKTITITSDNGLIYNHVNRIIIDREKNIFVGTNWGLSQLPLHLFKMYDTGDGLPHEFVWCFAQDNDSILIAGASGLSQLKNNTISTFPINRFFEKSIIRALIKTKDNHFLVCTWKNGIFKWDRGNTLERIYRGNRILAGISWNIGEKYGTSWFGTDNGLLNYDGKNFTLFHEGLIDKNIWCVTGYRNDSLLVGTDKGILEFRDGKFSQCPPGVAVGPQLVNDIKVLSESKIVVATELKGLYIYRGTHSPLIHLTTSNGLLNNDVWAVEADNRGNIWFNTSVSLSKYASNGFISHYNKKTGLQGDEGTLHAVLKDKRGRLFFGIAPGFIEIEEQEKTKDIPAPSLFISSIAVNGEPVNPNRHFVLPHNRNNIEFSYIAVTTRKENPVSYKTKLSPLDRRWAEVGHDTTIKYLNLPPDDYTFSVTANNGGNQNSALESLNEITFTIQKPFWWQWWFVTLAVLLLILLVLLIIKLRLKSLQNQKKYLEKIVQQRTEEIFNKNKELARLSITDPLTDLKNRRYLEEKIKEDISLIERHIYDQSKKENQPADNTAPPGLGVFLLDIDF
ncbi:MAG: hypothetical protein GY765_33935, partial [bacterium]|nr:hypothetical protein [bacterium]